MRTPRSAALSLLFLLTAITPALTGQPLCGTSAETDQRLRALRERRRSRIETHASPAASLRDGAIYVPADEQLVLGYRPFDLDGVSLVFEPRDASSFAMRREPLRYVEPSGTAIIDFQKNNATPFYVTRDLGFTLPIFGRSITRVHLSAFNAIHFDDPVRQGAMQFDELEAAVHRGAVLSPLMITSVKPRFLAYPEVFVDETPSSLIVTWRSSAGAEFGYDIQAELRSDGTVTYSYRSLRKMRWGAPVLSAGFDPATAARTWLAKYEDVHGDTNASVPLTLRPMVDVTMVDVTRIGGSDLFGVKVTLAGAIQPSSIPSGQALRYVVTVGAEGAYVDVDRNATVVTSFTSSGVVNGAAAHISGQTLEVFGIQREADAQSTRVIRVTAFYRPQGTLADQASFNMPFTIAPKRVASDLSTVDPSATLTLPITEPFVLGALDPEAIYQRIQPQFAINDYDYDAIAIYQTFFTDIIFFAGAYATRGNAQVNGISEGTIFGGVNAPRAPTLLHLNQLTYNYNAAPTTASKVMLHEFGHRWLYFISIRENGQTSRVLNPLSAHPAAYVHTPSVYRVYEDEESSVMGGGNFTQESDGRYRARALNHGFSWTDLYLMGLAAPEEVTPWFYLAGTSPALPGAYWPEDGIVVSGQKRAVGLDQIVAVHGPRDPSSALSQKRFRVAFVLVTDAGTDATEAEVAKMNEWRALLERNFAIATGGRGLVDTSVVKMPKKRGVR